MIHSIARTLFAAGLLVMPALGQDAYLKSTSSDALGQYGLGVATDGDTLAIGAQNGAAPAGGIVTVYVRSGSTWVLQQTILSPAGNALELFGRDVSLDGNTLAIGAPGFGDLASSTPFEGAVYVYVRSGTTWNFEALLTSTTPTIVGQLGGTVAISNDTIVAGTSLESAAHVYVRSGTTWTHEARLTASNPDPGDSFGSSVGLSGDTIVVGAPGEASAATGVGGNQTDNSQPGTGAAYVFERTGSTWVQQEYLKASNAGPDNFGSSVSVSGETAVIGAPLEQSAATGINGNESDNSFPGAGAAYVLVRNGSVWTQEAYLKPSNTGFADQFGFAVCVSEDELVVGAPTEESNAVGVGGDESNNAASQSGAAYRFERAGTVWSQQEYLKASNTDIGDTFGLGVAIRNGTALVGAPSEDSNALGIDGDASDNSLMQSGAAYVYDLGAGGTATFRNGGSNPASYSATTPQLGATFTGTVDLGGTSGHSLAGLLGFASPLTFTLGGGQVLLINPADPLGELLFQPPAVGPTAIFQFIFPNDAALIGFSLSTQAVHVGGVTPFALSNAQDLVLDF